MSAIALLSVATITNPFISVNVLLDTKLRVTTLMVLLPEVGQSFLLMDVHCNHMLPSDSLIDQWNFAILRIRHRSLQLVLWLSVVAAVT